MIVTGRVGAIARFKPLYNASAFVLEALCRQADEVVIGIGSSNKYNLRNPFTADESEDMIRAFLSDRFNNYSIIQIPDFGHIPEYRDGRKWKEFVIEKFKKLDSLVTSNEYVTSLLKDTYKIIRPVEIIWVNKSKGVKATQVRLAMAGNEDWEKLVPKEVAKYLNENGLVERFMEEFGKETLLEAKLKQETAEEEKSHVEED